MQGRKVETPNPRVAAVLRVMVLALWLRNWNRYWAVIFGDANGSRVGPRNRFVSKRPFRNSFSDFVIVFQTEGAGVTIPCNLGVGTVDRGGEADRPAGFWRRQRRGMVPAIGLLAVGC